MMPHVLTSTSGQLILKDKFLNKSKLIKLGYPSAQQRLRVRWMCLRKPARDGSEYPEVAGDVHVDEE